MAKANDTIVHLQSIFADNFQMVPKVQKSIGRKLQRKFSSKHESTLKSMGFLKLWNYFLSLTVYITVNKV